MNFLAFFFLPFWPFMFTIARCGLAQVLVELTSRLFLPPFMLRTNLLTGTSGTVPEDRLQAPGAAAADHAAQVDLHLAAQVDEQVRQFVVGGHEVDLALQLLVEQRRFRPALP